MYTPQHFKVVDVAEIKQMIEAQPFGILFSQTEQGPMGTHLPFFLVDEGEYGVLYGHMARANPHWQSTVDNVLVVFSGPHHYISPTWYQKADNVPTWNYTAVHAYGKIEVFEEREALLELLDRSVDFFESGLPKPWKMAESQDYAERILGGIVGFKIVLTKLEGKQKLNQNKSPELQQHVVEALRSQDSAQAAAVAELMERQATKKMAKE
ncbi:hypothetical protein CIG75_17700 [Tumebacillus algifaecis]|uniref:Transcriptional regulator n=1 Tax=Tumebacillus algifaecis TaxID=1214604 RepID=A0A223D4S4_9BACL|nr:FMN-binding negative transcriptional regulator [Tumebacillus algifaecis]ASS76619.1 hypothetical protein CIG75_17700 [Tumebacillus algifaecis]